MTVKKQIVKRKLLIVFGLLSVVLVIGSCLFYNLVITANKTISPTKDYQVSYNRLTKTITQQQLSTGIKWYEEECYNPTFFWSSNGKYLARNITSPYGNRRAEISDLEHSTVHTTLTKLDIQEMYEDTRTQNHDNYECVEITKWLDNTHVLIEFSWPSDIPGENIAGWCVYDFSSRTIKELAVVE
ncbi:hypothetical protein [Paenibacillus sp. GXUN7292]|uniref:hypothetical protein n=1 Tax=Paenibacillus sp. GXUN7292 TaxID=3422499 RepID=UPI003D7D6EE9